MGITFPVDDVTPATAPPRTRSLAEQLATPDLLALGGGERRVLIEATGDGLLEAVHHAYADHHPLVLTPDAIWLTILRGVTHHVRRNAERLRARLVRHEGTRKLTVETLRYAPEDPAWHGEMFGALRAALGQQIGEGPTRLHLCDFSTTTEVERLASEILLLDLYSPFFEYRFGIVCGIPSITVEGTPDDWRSIRARLDVIEELELAFWTRHLKRIVDGLVRAAEGAPDRAFFQRIYKPEDAYGTDLVTGWVGWLYPYVGKDAERPNPLLDHEIDATLPGERDQHGRYTGVCLRPDDVPVVLGTCDVEIAVSGGPTLPIHVEAGVAAVELVDGGALRPAVVWRACAGRSARGAMLERVAQQNALIDQLVAKHPHTAGSLPMNWGRRLPPQHPLATLYTRLGTLEGEGFSLLPYQPDERDVSRVARDPSTEDTRHRTWVDSVERVIVLEGGHVLALGRAGWARLEASSIAPRTTFDAPWIVGGKETMPGYCRTPAAEIPVVARSTEEILRWLLDPSVPLPVIGTLAELTPPWD